MFYPKSLADEIGLWKDDIIKSINGISVNNNIDKWLNYFKDDKIELSIERNLKNKQLFFELDMNSHLF